MVEEQEEIQDQTELENPAGDLIAQVGSATAIIFALLTFYIDSSGREVRGYQTYWGLVVLIFAAVCFVFSTMALWDRLMNTRTWLDRVPGWIYMAASFTIVVFSVLAMAIGYKGYEKEFYPLLAFFSGLFICVGALLKF